MNKNVLVKLMLLAAAVMWGFSFVVMPGVLKEVSVLWFLAVRFSVTALLLAAVFFKKLKKINKSYLLHSLISGTVLFGGYIFQTTGIMHTTPGNNAFLTTVYCVVVPFLFWAFAKKKPDRFNVIAAVVCIAGIGFVSVTEGFAGVNVGDMLTLVCGVLFAFHIVSLSIFGKEKDPVVFAVLQFAVFGILAWTAILIFNAFSIEALNGFYATPSFADWNIMLVLRILYFVVCCSAVGFIFQAYAQKHVNPSSASLIISTEAVFGVIFSIMFGMELMTVFKAVGFGLIFFAIIISETKLSFLKRKRLLEP